MRVLETFPRESLQTQDPETWMHPDLVELDLQISQAWPDRNPARVLEWTEDPLVALDNCDVPWFIGPAERDPLRDERGRLVLPRKQRTQLKRIAKLSLPFQRVAIAHELDPEGPVQKLLPALSSGSQLCSDEDARALVGRIPANPGLTRALQALDSAVRVATSTVPSGIRTMLDPIIFGIIAPNPPEHGEICLWYPLVAWRW
jgi:hypothetical protein